MSPMSAALSDTGARIVHIVRSSVGLRVPDADALMLWVAERVHVLALPGVEQYRALLEADGDAGRRERELMTVHFTTGESFFWRDPGQCDLLARTILPELIARRARRHQRVLRLWSAGCAAGDEAYTLAMLVDELAQSSLQLARWQVLILGTDIDGLAIARAQAGLFGDWSLRGLDAARKQRYFQSCDRGYQIGWQIDARLRQMVTFRRGDLVHDVFPDAATGLIDFDLILCRNVFIYLDGAAVDLIVAKFAAALTEGGYLLTAPGEMPGHGAPHLDLRLHGQIQLFQKAALRPDPRQLMAASMVASTSVPMVAPIVPAQPSVDDLMRSAWRHADNNLLDAAQQDCVAVLALDALDARPYYLLAQLAQQRGDLPQAMLLLKKAIYLEPGCIAAYLELGALHGQAGDGARARRMYQTARAALKKLPQEAVVPYRGSTAQEMLVHVERLLGAPEGEET
jgi:chemotaxis protein methyltransferase CheR